MLALERLLAAEKVDRLIAHVVMLRAKSGHEAMIPTFGFFGALHQVMKHCRGVATNEASADGYAVKVALLDWCRRSASLVLDPTLLHSPFVSSRG